MVGRLFKVRCRECRRRKIKCPAEQPSCSRCVQNGFDCPGYEDKGLEFVNTTGPDIVSRQSGNKKAQASKAAHTRLPKSASRFVSRTDQLLIPHQTGNRSRPPSYFLDTSFSMMNPPSTVAATITQLFATCIDLDFKLFVTVPSETEIVANWVFDLPTFSIGDTLLEHALLAVTMIHLGKSSNDQNILRNARQCYGAALNEFQVAARRPLKDARLLTACNIMCMYELYDSIIAQVGGFMEHLKGAQILGMAIDASNLTRPEDIRTYYVFRSLAIYNSLGARKSCPVAHIKRPPLYPNTDSKDVLNFSETLEDITMFIPGLVEKSDDLLELPWTEENERQFNLICTQFGNITNELSAWYAHVHDLFPTPFWNEPAYTFHHPDTDFGPSYQFTSYWVAQSLMHYWFARITLYDAYAQALQWKHNLPFHDPPGSLYQPPPFDPTPLAQRLLDRDISSFSPPQAYTLTRYSQRCFANNLRKSLHYIWSGDFGICSIFRATPAAFVASRFFESFAGLENEVGDEARCQLRWMEGVQRYYEKMGLAIGELSKVKAEDWKRMLEYNPISR